MSPPASAGLVRLPVSSSLYFGMSYGQPPDTYTGQDWDRAASWLMLAVSMAAIALAILTGYFPARLRRIRAHARGDGLGLLPWLGTQRRAFLFGNLVAVNLPLMVFLLVAGMLIAIAEARVAIAPVWLPAGSLLSGAGMGFVLSAAEVWLLRRGRPHGRKPPPRGSRT